MSKFDLNLPQDFARLTVSPAADILSTFTGRDPAKWDIVEASFISNRTLQKNPKAKPIKFLVFESVEAYQAGLSDITDTGGRRKVKFQFPYRDGQTTDDLGKKPEEFSLNVLIYGPRYKKGLQALLDECNQPSPGVLRHPVRGELPVAIEDYELIHAHDSRKAVAIRIRFTEHTFTIDKVTQETPAGDKSVKSALLKGLAAINTVNNVITKVQAFVFAVSTLKTKITNALNDYKAAYTKLLQLFNTTFNTGSSTDLPALLPVQNGGTSDTQGNQVTNTFTTVISPNDPFINIDPVNTALIQLAATQQAVDQTNALRDQIEAIINDLKSQPEGALIFYDEILALKRGAIDMQAVLEASIQSSRARVVQYTTPRLMSVREIAFAVGLDVERSYEIAVLNPTLLSTNFVDRATTLQVPVE